MESTPVQKKILEHNLFISILQIAVPVICLYGLYSEIAIDKDWFMSSYIALLWCLAFFDFARYKIVYEDGTITWTRLFRKTISVKLSEVARVNIRSFFWRSFENPCISIVGKNAKEIRVGIGFFKDSEIRWLLGKIHEARPDLPLPKTWQRYYYRPWLTIES